MYTTEGIILRRSEVGEAGFMFTIYTADYGKIRAYAQGVRKNAAKLKGHLEPLSRAQVHFVLGKNGERLTGASLVNYWDSLRADPAKLAVAFKVASAVDRYCLAGEKDEEIWRLLTGALAELEKRPPARPLDPAPLGAFLKSFEEKFLECLGYGGEKNLEVLSREF